MPGIFNQSDNSDPIAPPAMDELELRTILATEIRNALGQEGGKLSEDRRKSLEYYEGQPFGNEIQGQSQVVSRNVMEAVEWVLPALIRLYCGTDHIVEFEPYRPGDEDAAEQCTEYVNFILTKDNNFFMLCHDWFKTALIQKNGYIKVYWNEQKSYTTESFTGLSDLEYQQLVQADDVEILEEKTYDNPDPGMTWYTEDSPQPMAPVLHDVKLRVWRQEGRIKIENVNPEEILVSARCSGVLDGKHFVSQRSERTVSDLRELGYDEDLIQQAVGTSNSLDFNSERVSRYESEDDFFGEGRTDEAARTILIEESWLPVDFDGDGYVELRRIVSSGEGAIIFENEAADDCPIIAITPLPMPGRHTGLSLADLTMDLQEIKSSILRQILQNSYLTNSPRMLVNEHALSENSVSDLLSVAPGRIVRVNDVTGVTPLVVPFVAGASLPLVDYIDATQEIRTGVSRRNVGLSPDDLNKTASGISMIQAAAAQRCELIARIFGEMGIKPLAKRILGLIIKHQQEARIIRLTGKWIAMDVRGWRESFDVSVSVGLGTGNRDQVIAHLNNILAIQQQMVQAQQGVEGPLVMATDIYAVVSRLVENCGFKTQFFTDPKTVPPKPPKPDASPEMALAQATIMATNAKAQADVQVSKMKAEHSMAIEKQKADNDMLLERMKMEHQIQLEREREHAKAELAMFTAQTKAAMSPPPNGSF